MLAKWCQINHVFHAGEKGSRRQRSTIDTVIVLIDRMQEAWVEGKLVGRLLIYMKGAFCHVYGNYQLRTMEGMGADRDLI